MCACMQQQECGYPCSNRNKCRTSFQPYRNDNIHEAPVKDSRNKDIPEEYDMRQCPPPEQPPGQNGDWELQFCKWWGWTWVKKDNDKDDKDVSFGSPRRAPQSDAYPSQEVAEDMRKGSDHEQAKKKKSGGCFKCFQKKKKPSRSPEPVKSSSSSQMAQPQPQPQPQPKPQPQAQRPARKRSDHDTDKTEDSTDYDECCCCGIDTCCPCSQVCCPCMLQNQICCCCCDAEPQPEPQRRRCSKTIETQTCCKEVKEQATKMSEMYIQKHHKSCPCKRKRVRCRRQVCCPCMRSTCCPCVQTVCCNCKGAGAGVGVGGSGGQINDNPSSNIKVNNSSLSPVGSNEYNDQLINYCLTSNRRQPLKTDFLNFRSTNFSTLHKSLDLLLKNNINIMSLFDDKKEIKQTHPRETACFDSKDTIACISSENLGRRSDPEHCKLLTAVCDAILSSHKFDNDKLSSRVASAKSTHHHHHCEPKESQNTFNIFSSKGLLEKILSDMNFTKSNENLNAFKEMGVQVSQKQSRKVEPRISLTKLVRNKSRILTAPRFPKRVEALRKNIDLLRMGYHESRNHKKCSVHTSGKGYRDDRKSKTINDNKLGLADMVRNCEEEASNRHQRHGFEVTAKASPATTNLEQVENLLSTIEYINSGTEQNDQARDPFFQDRQSFNLLDATSPPFTDLDLLLNFDDGKQDRNSNR